MIYVYFLYLFVYIVVLGFLTIWDTYCKKWVARSTIGLGFRYVRLWQEREGKKKGAIDLVIIYLDIFGCLYTFN